MYCEWSPPRASTADTHLILQRRLCSLCQEHQDPARAGRRLYLYVPPQARCLRPQPSNSGCVTDEGYDLVIWGGAEVAITICAASVPLLRVLIREVRSLTRQRYGYVQAGAGSAAEEGTASHKKDPSEKSRPSRSSTLVESGETGKGHRWTLDMNRDSYRGAAFGGWPGEESSKENTPKPLGGKILRVSEFEMQYHQRQEKGDDGTASMV